MAGQARSLKKPLPRLAGVGEQTATFVVVPLPRDQAAALLPDELQLLPCDVAGQGKHPLLCMFGRQRNVHTSFPLLDGRDTADVAKYLGSLSGAVDGSHLKPLALNYLEIISVVPFVGWSDAAAAAACPGPFVWAPRLYLDQPVAIFLGWLVGYAKEFAWINGDQTSMAAAGLDNAPRLTGWAHPRGPGAPPTAFPKFADLRKILKQPVMGCTVEGTYIRTTFDYQLDQARVWPALAEVRLTDQFFHGLLPEITWSVDGIDTQPLGGLCIDVPWRLTDPVVCPPA